MHSTNFNASIQPQVSTTGYLHIPSYLERFVQTLCLEQTDVSGQHTIYECSGFLEADPTERICPVCGHKLHIKSSKETTLRHLPFGDAYTHISFRQDRFFCEHCGHSHMEKIPFKADRHNITKALKTYVEDLLSLNTFTNRAIAEMTGLGSHTVAAIDKARLARKYVKDGKLKMPDTYSRFLCIDEFKLHNGHQYATHIIDLETGHVLWIARGKKKQVVYDFIEAVGMEWMDHVEAVACDMNSDFEEAFEEKCEWITIVFDHFHIVKNFNDKVVSAVRKDEQNRLKEAGLDDKARNLKGSKYILTSSRESLAKKDAKAEAGAMIQVENTLFGLKPILAKSGYVQRYKQLIKENELLLACDIIKEQLDAAYQSTDENEMARLIIEIIDTCNGTKNRHFEWFGRLLLNHFEGIISHATYKLSSGKIEGINNKIKTLRRQAYGYRDDGYFFLKIIDASRSRPARNPKSHRIFH